MKYRTRVAGVSIAALVAVLATVLLPLPALASRWGSSYGDPYGFCPAHSFLPRTYGVLITNDVWVGSNPEQSTFWGIHRRPGYDDWYGRWYGDFAGRPGADSGWKHLMRVRYGRAGRWNFASYGWQVHGHVKQYIAYYNWTFGGQCGFGRYGRPWPAPYMADVYGTPVLDIYVDSVPPFPPQPRVTHVDTSSVGFTWDPVADRGDGAGRDYYAVGMGDYISWLTVGSGPRFDAAVTASPRSLTAGGLRAGSTACLHVVAEDRLGNSTPETVACGQPLAPPPMPPLAPGPFAVAANPSRWGLTGLASWFWLTPTPGPVTVEEEFAGHRYRIGAVPTGVTWNFGDGAGLEAAGPAASGLAYPARSTVRHTYQAQSHREEVGAVVHYQVSWSAEPDATVSAPAGPYPLGTLDAGAAPLGYPVRQAQPELIGLR